MYPDTTQVPMIEYRDNAGTAIFRIERDGTIYIKGLVMHDGTTTQTASGFSGSVDGGAF